jgi:hypothetical protein
MCDVVYLSLLLFSAYPFLVYFIGTAFFRRLLETNNPNGAGQAF